MSLLTARLRSHSHRLRSQAVAADDIATAAGLLEEAANALEPTRTAGAVYVGIHRGKMHRAGCISITQARPERRHEVPAYAGLDRRGILDERNRRRRRNGLPALDDAVAGKDLHGCVT